MSKRVFWFCCSHSNDCEHFKIQKISEDIDFMDALKLVTKSRWYVPSHHLLYQSVQEVLDADHICVIDDLDPESRACYHVYAQGFIYDSDEVSQEDVNKAKTKIANAVVQPYQHALEIVRRRLDENIVQVTSAVLKAKDE